MQKQQIHHSLLVQPLLLHVLAHLLAMRAHHHGHLVVNALIEQGVVDHVASAEQGEVIFQDEGFNEDKFKDYFRFDIKTTYKINKEKVTHEIGVDLVNLTGAQNILNYSYAPNSTPELDDDVVENYQLGFLPIFYYRIDF